MGARNDVDLGLGCREMYNKGEHRLKEGTETMTFKFNGRVGKLSLVLETGGAKKGNISKGSETVLRGRIRGFPSAQLYLSITLLG